MTVVSQRTPPVVPFPLLTWSRGHYKLICPSSFHPDRYLYSMNHEEIDATIADLSSLQTSDLKKLYERVSDSLPDRNGWVAEFNLVLMAVMGCNTNSILLGCEEQSKSAAFYIGETMCDLIVAQCGIFSQFSGGLLRPLYMQKPGATVREL